MTSWRNVLSCSSVIVGLGAASGTLAQQAANTGLEEVVVTAQRRLESLQDVPISITVATGEQLEKAGVTRLEDIAVIAPAVQLSRTGVYTQPAVRGVTSTLAGNYENNVAIYVDGYYLPLTRGLNTELVNINQVQVLKGPQGTLFGRNATGGAILVQTLDPSMTERSGRLNATYRSYEDIQAQGYFSTPITDTLAWNVAASYREADSYIKDVSGFPTAPIENYNVTTKLRWQPTDNLTISGKYEMLQVSDGRTLAITYEGRSLVVFQNPGTYLETRDNRTSVNFPVRNSTDQDTAAAKIEYDLGWGRITSVTAYQRESDRLNYDLDGTTRRYFEQRTRDENEVISEDLNLTSSGDGPIQYTLGFYYFDSELKTPDTSSLSFPSTVYVPGQTNLSKTEAYAGYADVTWQVADKLFLTGGIRYSDETKDLVVRGGTGALLFDGDESFDKWTPRAVIRYQLNDASSLYASYSQGFKSGFINIAAPAFNTVDPEEIDAYEVGYKTAHDRWRLDTAAYYYDYKDLQVSSLLIVNGINTQLTTNAASAEIYGAEGQFSAALTDTLNLNAGVAYTHARYDEFPNASYNAINAAGLNTTNCPNATPPPATRPCTQDWSGQRLVRAPDWTGNVGADYTLETGIGRFVLAGHVFYTSAYAPVRGDLFADGTYRYEEDGYTLVNVRASWSPAALEAFTLTAFGENIGDSRYYFYRTGNAFGDYHVLGPPQTWGISADFRF